MGHVHLTQDADGGHEVGTFRATSVFLCPLKFCAFEVFFTSMGILSWACPGHPARTHGGHELSRIQEIQ